MFKELQVRTPHSDSDNASQETPGCEKEATMPKTKRVIKSEVKKQGPNYIVEDAMYSFDTLHPEDGRKVDVCMTVFEETDNAPNSFATFKAESEKYTLQVICYTSGRLDVDARNIVTGEKKRITWKV